MANDCQILDIFNLSPTMNMQGSEWNASKKAFIKARRRNQQSKLKEVGKKEVEGEVFMEEVGKKEVEEKVIMPEEEIFARWRSSTATIMAMFSDEEFLEHKRKEEAVRAEAKKVIISEWCTTKREMACGWAPLGSVHPGQSFSPTKSG